jgi:hypothetical protein
LGEYVYCVKLISLSDTARRFEKIETRALLGKFRTQEPLGQSASLLQTQCSSGRALISSIHRRLYLSSVSVNAIRCRAQVTVLAPLSPPHLTPSPCNQAVALLPWAMAQRSVSIYSVLLMWTQVTFQIGSTKVEYRGAD